MAKTKIKLDDPDTRVLLEYRRSRDSGYVFVRAQNGKIYDAYMTRQEKAARVIECNTAPLGPIAARMRAIKIGVEPAAFEEFFGHPPDQPTPAEKLIDGVMYRTAKFDLICRYVRSVRAYEPDYATYRRDGPSYLHFTSELLRTGKGKWVITEDLSLSVSQAFRLPDEDEVKEILEEHAPHRYGEFFEIEEA